MIVLDTHAWIWYVDSPRKLGPAAREAIETARSTNQVYVSSISAWEVYMLDAKGRLSLGVPVAAWVSRCEQLDFLQFVPVDNLIARHSVEACATMHGDPADRIIVATALCLGAGLVTRGTSILACGIVDCVW